MGEPVLAAVAGRQHGVFTRADALATGYSASAVARQVRAAAWVRLQPGVYRSALTPPSLEQAALAACLRAGPAAMASHRTAAWLWDMLEQPPDTPDITVDHLHHPHPARAVVHRTRAPVRRATRRGVPCTEPMRTLVDIAAIVPPGVLDDAVDRGMAHRWVTPDRLFELSGQLRRTGRQGPEALRASLRRRGLVQVPHHSVLESRTLRLLARAGIRPLAVEVVAGPNGEYRLDILLAPRVALEVDGYVWHSSATSKANDERRRHLIRMGGTVVFVATWIDVVHNSERFLDDVRALLAATGAR